MSTNLRDTLSRFAGEKTIHKVKQKFPSLSKIEVETNEANGSMMSSHQPTSAPKSEKPHQNAPPTSPLTTPSSPACQMTQTPRPQPKSNRPAQQLCSRTNQPKPQPEKTQNPSHPKSNAKETINGKAAREHPSTAPTPKHQHEPIQAPHRGLIN